MKLALTGGTGLVGQFLLQHLAQVEPDWPVRALCRPGADARRLGANVTWQAGVLPDAALAASLVQGCDALVHAALQHRPGRYRGGEGDDPLGFWRANFMATLELLAAAHQAGVQRVVLLSSRAVFSRRAAALADPGLALPDDHPLWPDSHYGALKAATEALLGLWPGMTVCALRPTGIYGLVQPVAASKWFDLVHGRAALPTTTRTEVHGLDVARALLLLLTQPAAKVAGRSFNCSDLEVTPALLADALGQATGRQLIAPAPVPPAANVMACAALRGLGWQPGGAPLLQQTLAELAELAGPD